MTKHFNRMMREGEQDEKKEEEEKGEPEAGKKEDPNQIPENKRKSNVMEYKLQDNPLLYFFNMFSSHVYLGTMTWGDLYRLTKYYRMFSQWGDKKGPRMYLVFPNLISEDDLRQYEGVFFLKEKNIVQEIIISFRENKEVDRVTYELPIDFLCFTRYFSFEIMAQ